MDRNFDATFPTTFNRTLGDQPVGFPLDREAYERGVQDRIAGSGKTPRTGPVPSRKTIANL